MNGALVVDKPSGCTSHDVVARVRRATGVRRIGHTGTLDPLATGVLPLLLGPATRLARFLTAADKIYDARIRLGVATDTYDVTGRPLPPGVGHQAASVPGEHRIIEEALAGFRGTIVQTPPPFSAKWIGGVRAYTLARRRASVRPAPVAVTVHSLRAVRFEGDVLDLRLTCSSGFYVRALANDLGERLGCGAHLETLRRLRAGEFDIDQAVPLDTLEAEGPACGARLLPIGRLLPEFPGVVLSDQAVRRAAKGNPVPPSGICQPSGEGRDVDGPGSVGVIASHYRLFDQAGTFIAIAQPRPDRSLHPVVVLV